MIGEVWRLYRHIIIGGAAILLLVFSSLAYLQQKTLAQSVDSSVCADVYLSAAVLAASPDSIADVSTYSRYRWQILSSISPAFVQDFMAEVASLQWQESARGDVSVLYNGTVILSGQANGPSPLLQLPSLIDLLRQQGLWQGQLQAFFESAPCFDVEVLATLSDSTQAVMGVDEQGVLQFIVPQADRSALSVSMRTETSSMLFSEMALIVILAVLGMCLLVWRELRVLDRKRRYFEIVTRQIARGRSGLPKGIVDSNGALKELAYSFDSMSSHIQRLLKVQREMINAISHELRTPIARLRFGLEALKDDIDENDHGTVIALEGDVEELNTLVDEVLTYGKLEEGSLALNFESTSLRQLLNGVLEHNQNLLKHLTVDVHLDDDDIVNADPHHLHRALQNLILNASKYASSKIVITYTNDAERWQVDIEDDGPGIPPEDRDKVFIPFQRLDNSRTRASGGYGLGLAIVQRIAFWHGGAVLVEESSMGGAKFSLIWSRSQHQNSLLS
jgi:two-component system sensor histidine kinase RstB